MAQRLGSRQRLVLNLLAMGQKSVRQLADDGFGVEESSIRNAVDSLYERGYVLAVRFDGRSRVWGLTHSGAALEKTLIEEDEDDG